MRRFLTGVAIGAATCGCRNLSSTAAAAVEEEPTSSTAAFLFYCGSSTAALTCLNCGTAEDDLFNCGIAYCDAAVDNLFHCGGVVYCSAAELEEGAAKICVLL